MSWHIWHCKTLEAGCIVKSVQINEQRTGTSPHQYLLITFLSSAITFPNNALDNKPKPVSSKNTVIENRKIIEYPMRFYFSETRGKKNPLNNLLPSYFLGRPILLYVITWKNKNHTALHNGEPIIRKRVA